MRLIDAHALYGMLPHADLDHDERISKCGAIADFIMIISEAPTVDPVKHGKWVKGKDTDWCPNFDDAYYCSTCRHEAYWDTDYGQQKFNYCPFCGAKMDEEVKHETD